MTPLVTISRDLCERSSSSAFPSVPYVYNPLVYARAPHEAYLERWGSKSPREVLMIGMNPGPFGMAQTGVPFGDVAMVRDFVGITGARRQAAARAPCATDRRVRLPPLRGQRDALLGLGAGPLRDCRALLRPCLRGELVPARLHGRVGAEPDARPAACGRARAALSRVRRGAREDRRDASPLARDRRRRLRREAGTGGARDVRDDRLRAPSEPGEPGGEPGLGRGRRTPARRARLRTASVASRHAPPLDRRADAARDGPPVGAQPERDEVHPHATGSTRFPYATDPLRPRGRHLRGADALRRADAPRLAAPRGRSSCSRPRCSSSTSSRFVFALDLTTASTIGLVLGAIPIFAALFGLALGTERPTSRFWVAAAMSALGVGLVAAGAGGEYRQRRLGDPARPRRRPRPGLPTR